MSSMPSSGAVAGPAPESSRPRQRGRGRGDSGAPNARGRGADRGRGRGRGRGGRGQSDDSNRASAQAAPSGGPRSEPVAAAKPSNGKAPALGTESAEEEVCFICANPVIHWAITPCNHITCHTCALRMRALYKNKDCPHCRTQAPYVVFTDDAAKRYEEYSAGSISSTDDNIGIRYTSEDIVGDTVLLLRYNCPDESCDYAGLGWHDLQRHVRTTHHRKMCDLCVRNKKIFTHEQDLFTDKELEKHMRHGDDRPGAIDQTGFRGHPLCSFCGERFYDDDKLYEHCRNKHERCFLCDRQNPRTPHYYYNYEALEQHFKKDHFPCLDRECLEKKFIVFGSELDLKAHQLSDHGDSLSKDLRRDARIVDMSSFDYRRSYQQERREAGASARDGRGGGRGRDPNAEPPPVTSAQPLRRDELAFQRQMAIHSTGGSLAGRTFGGQVNPPSSSSSAAGPSRGPSQSSSAQPIPALERLSLGDGGSAPRTPEQQAQLVRHAAVIERASNLLANDPTKMETFRNNISMYNKGAMTPRNLIDAFLALFADSSSNAVGIVVREVADLFDDKAKTEALRKAWNDWRAINEDYPSLPGLDGMRGATTASTGWAAAVAATPSAASAATTLQQQLGHTTRVLRLKSATRRSSTSSTGTSAPASSTSAAPAASSSNLRPLRQVPEERTSSAFPALPTSRGPGSATPSAMAANHRSLWSVPASSRAAESQPTAPRPSLNSEESFPSLPAAPKPMTTIFGYGGGRGVRRDLVGSAPSVSAWGTGGASSAGAGHGESGDQEAAAVDGGAKGGKKGRQGKKQVLMQWG